MSKRVLVSIVAVMLLVGLPVCASADNINITGGSHGYEFSYSLNGGSLVHSYATEFAISWGTWDTAYGYCIDPSAPVESGVQPYDYVAKPEDAYLYSTQLNSSEAGLAVGWLLSQFCTSLSGTATNQVDITALQIAIWEVIYDYSSSVSTSLDLSGGTFQFGSVYLSGWVNSGLTSLVEARVNYMLSTLPMGTTFTSEQIDEINEYFRIGADSELQDLAFGTSGGDGTPEPGTMLLLGSAMAMGGYLRRRRSHVKKV